MNLLRLLRRAASARLAFSLLLCFVSPAFLVMAYLMGSGELWWPRSWHPYATLGCAAVALAANAAFQSMAMRLLYADFEEALARVRANIVRLLVTSELQVVRGVGATEMASVVAADARLVAAAAPSISVVAVFFSLVVVALVVASIQSLVAIAVYMAIMGLAYSIRAFRGDAQPAKRGDAAEARFRAVYADLAGGPRELAVDRRKAADLAAAAEVEARDAARQRSIGGGAYTTSFASTEAFLQFAVLAVHELSTGVVPGVKVSSEIMVLLVCISGPLIRVMHSRYELEGANRAARRILALEAGLRAAPRVPAATTSLADFAELRFEGVTAMRPPRSDADNFVLGPVDLTIRRGSVTVVRGSNGSGKSTLLEVLLGYLRPRAGTLSVDGKPIETSTLDAYRQLFSVVFANPHLFDEMYGHAADVEQAQAWLMRLGLPDLSVNASRKTSTALSTGQRKRLALARALAEARPVLVLDEYTADQDPAAREHFLTEILPQLKAEGRTVIAVLHGSAVPACVDRVVRLADGRLMDDPVPTAA